MLNDLNSHALELLQLPLDLPQHALDQPQRTLDQPQRALDLPQRALDLPQHALDLYTAPAAPASARTRLTAAQGVHRKCLIRGRLSTTAEALRHIAAAVHHHRCGDAPLPLTQVWRARR